MSTFSSLAKLLIFSGVVLIIIGAFFLVAPKIPFLGNLPGDIIIQRKNFSLYFPLTTMIIISIILSLIVRFFR